MYEVIMLTVFLDLNGECFVDSRDRILPIQTQFQSKNDRNMTIEECKDRCFVDNDYLYAGVQNKNQCFCGNNKPYSFASQSQCNQLCSGDSSQICGGHWRMNIYQNKGQHNFICKEVLQLYKSVFSIQKQPDHPDPGYPSPPLPHGVPSLFTMESDPGLCWPNGHCHQLGEK